MPQREDDQLTSATRLLAKRREMAEVEHALSAQKEVQILRSAQHRTVAGWHTLCQTDVLQNAL